MAGLSRRQLAWRTLGLSSVTPDKVTSQEQQRTSAAESIVALVGGGIAWAVWSFAFSPFTLPALGVAGDLIAASSFVIIVGMTVWYFGLGPIRRLKFRCIADIYLAAGQCAACKYSLDGLESEVDDRIICPECNAAWSCDRIGLQP
ncbi:MAG: hypothetical protein AB8F26_10360 [Phycisphaerales bacterium]